MWGALQGEGDGHGWTIDAAEPVPVTPHLSLGLILVMNGTHRAPAFNALAVPHVDNTPRTEQVELIFTLRMDLTGVFSKRQGTQT